MNYDNGTPEVVYKETGITGKDAQEKLERIGLSVNKNTLPGDTNPSNPSGLRLGTAAITTRGLGYKEIELLGDIITEALTLMNPEAQRR